MTRRHPPGQARPRAVYVRVARRIIARAIKAGLPAEAGVGQVAYHAHPGEHELIQYLPEIELALRNSRSLERHVHMHSYYGQATSTEVYRLKPRPLPGEPPRALALRRGALEHRAQI